MQIIRTNRAARRRNVRQPSIAISSDAVLGVLSFLDRMPPAPVPASAKRAPKPLRYPEDFPAMKSAAALDAQIIEDFRTDADIMIEMAARHDEAGDAMIESAEGINEAECELVEDDAAEDEPAIWPPASFRVHSDEPKLFPSLPLANGPLRERATFVPRPDPIAQRRERLTAAVDWLKREKCILVMVEDRTALVRSYRVSGLRYALLADGVIEHALSLGMPPLG